jgi:hypothetical protein
LDYRASLRPSIALADRTRIDEYHCVRASRFELLVDGRSRWKAKSEDDARAWLREYRDEHAQDDPDAVHVQIRRLTRWSWLTGGAVVDRQRFL